jgi:hypothetical protein
MLHDLILRRLREVFVKASRKGKKSKGEAKEVFVKEEEAEVGSVKVEEILKILNLHQERFKQLQLERTQMVLIQFVEKVIEPGYTRNLIITQTMLLEELDFTKVVEKIKEAQIRRGLPSIG